MGFKQYKKAMKSVRATAPTAGIEMVYASYGASVRPVKRLKGAVLYSTLVVVPAIVVMAALLLTKPAKAVTLEGMLSALEEAPAVHITSEPSGNEQWIEGEKQRYQITGVHVNYKRSAMDRGFDGERIWAIHHDKRLAEIATKPKWGFGNGYMTLDERIADIKKTAHGTPVVKESGNDGSRTITIEGVGYGGMYEPYRVVFTVDPVTERPVRQEYFRKSEGEWKSTGHLTFEYPKDIPDSIFEFNPPKDFVVADYDKALGKIVDALEGNGVSKTVGGVTVTLLGAVHGEYGEVWVLWKGGATPPLFAGAAAFDTEGVQKAVDFVYEYDDRTRERNYGVPPKEKPVPVPRDEQILILRPMGYYKGEPYYALGFWSGPNTPVETMEFNVVLPVCEEVEPFIQQTGKYLKHQTTGRQIGSVDFRVKSYLVGRKFEVVMDIDPDHFPTMGRYSAKNPDLTSAEVRAIRDEFFRKRTDRIQGR